MEDEIVVTKPLMLYTSIKAFVEWLESYFLSHHSPHQLSVWHTYSEDGVSIGYHAPPDGRISFLAQVSTPEMLTIKRMTYRPDWGGYFQQMLDALRQRWGASSSDLRRLVLEKYYQKRKDDFISANAINFEGLQVSEVLRVSQQLHDQGLIEFRSLRGDDKTVAGSGKITPKGIDAVELSYKAHSATEQIMDNDLRQAFVSPSRIAELRSITSQQYDLTKLIRLCEELNICYSNKCFFAVPVLTRSILDHVPPVFGFNKFEEVVASYGGPKENKSFKKNMQHLQDSLRNIADAYLHQVIREKETLPNETQVNFSNDLDVLLAEVVRKLK